ncbi:MAG: DUF4010 domain-containing protein [Bacteroidetes bacterium]|nr:DUF4010 domain-containing protein [Bacteroidota bacterium]
MNNLFSIVPENLFNFVLVTLFSLIIGLAQRRLHPSNDEIILFGTDRTFTFIGILGYILYIIRPESLVLYMGGGAILGLLFGLFYHRKLESVNKYGITTIIIALITYCLAPLIITQPKWLSILIVVTVLIFTELKDSFIQISQKFDRHEFITLGIFLAIAGVVLPIVPDTQFVSYLSLTPYKIWLAVVAISTISYFSYLLKKFVFKKSGILVSGILGGLYSSTASTFILAKKSKSSTNNAVDYASAIIFATSMMYIRILILMLIFNKDLSIIAFPYFAIMIIVSIGTASGILYFKKKSIPETENTEIEIDKNPLEFKVAIIFTVLYVAFTFATYYTIVNFGSNGLNVLSLIVGVTDIDPFLLNLFQGKYQIANVFIAIATFQAIISNNILKAIYATILSNKAVRKYVLTGFGIIIASNLVLILILYLLG